MFFRSRNLTESEMDSSYRLFRNSIRYHLIRVNEREKWIAKRLNIAYVSFETIHIGRAIQPALLIHELVHVWQYTQFGSVYIYKALLAQKSKPGYNYGGVPGLNEAIEARKKLHEFNFEQQGDIISDYYKLSSGIKPHWVNSNVGNLLLYRSFLGDLLDLRRFTNNSIRLSHKQKSTGDGMA